jgi:hypothetical protein
VEGRGLEHGADGTRRIGEIDVAAAEDRRRASRGSDQTDQHPQRGRLAGAVAAEKPGDGAGGDGEAEIVDGDRGAEPFRQVVHLDCVHTRQRGLGVSRCRRPSGRFPLRPST